MHARLFLAWLAIAIIAVLAQSSNEYDEESDDVPLKVRSALAEEALGVLDEHGEKVDVSLDGYDHDLVARDLEDEPTIEGLEGRDAGLDYEALRKLGRMKPHHVQHHARDDEDDQDDVTPYVDLDPEDEDDDEDADAPFADDEPDPVGDADKVSQPPIAERAAGDDDEDFEEVFDDEEDDEEVEQGEPGSYDSGLYERSFGLDSEDEEIDYSLEGYDPSILRRGEDDDDEFDEETFDFHSFLSESPDSPASASGAHISERDIAADADEDFEGSTDEWYQDERRNARYVELDPEPTVLVGKPLQAKRDIVPDVDEDDEGEGTFSPTEETEESEEDDRWFNE
ncbi:hypothetical protein M409DRAFT_52542 [Zasmidium cellare ATCC 36951]|uniref:Uncharacterized protein n=1 Tax=Zasmidium cellare ATCC 36951 TaxID=1080233 RepID=A0A6A6CRG1_ZASCE|nr:uncharacterized protein M409DRAFT_52542 [Zasmidium cellare ATCC 36951]KAF2169283.1 hypothetical protein M409DRAFT_52542 [Zasmidium cellare ATCC 36951]